MKLFATSLEKTGLSFQIVGDPTLFDVVFTDTKVIDYRSWLTGDSEINSKFNASLRSSGILKSPGKLYPCLALTEEDFEKTEAALAVACAAITSS